MRRLILNLRETREIWDIPDWAVEEIAQEIPPGWEMIEIGSAADGRGDGGQPPAEVLDAVDDAEIYIGYGFPPALFDAAHAGGASKLRWVHSAAAGVGGSLHAGLRNSSIVLTNSAGVHAPPMAETLLAMILYFARGLDFALDGQRRGVWDKAPFEAASAPVREISEATLGILGFGGIGRELARRATALGMRVLAQKRRPAEAPPGVELLFGEKGLDRLLRESDYVAMALPETDDTRGLIGADEIACLKAEAVLLNVGRGSAVDEGALIDALRDGRLRGAGLDVFTREPLPPDSALWSLPNVLILPHVSATSASFWRRQTDLIVQNLRRYRRGEPLRNVVDKRLGY
ncbi:D-2-hydroxyacid dehydrogenase [soil metagenome]